MADSIGKNETILPGTVIAVPEGEDKTKFKQVEPELAEGAEPLPRTETLEPVGVPEKKVDPKKEGGVDRVKAPPAKARTGKFTRL